MDSMPSPQLSHHLLIPHSHLQSDHHSSPAHLRESLFWLLSKTHNSVATAAVADEIACSSCSPPAIHPQPSLFREVEAFGRRAVAIRQDLELPFSADLAEEWWDEDTSSEISPSAIDAFQRLQLPSALEDDHHALPVDDDDDFFSSDEFRMFEFKVKRCPTVRSHDWTECPFSHPGEKARRRDPRRFHYSGIACADFRARGECRKGNACEFSHGVFECWLHPSRYRTQACKDGAKCRRRVCFFAHTPHQLRLLPSPFESNFPDSPLSLSPSSPRHDPNPPFISVPRILPSAQLKAIAMNDLVAAIQQLEWIESGTNWPHAQSDHCSFARSPLGRSSADGKIKQTMWQIQTDVSDIAAVHVDRGRNNHSKLVCGRNEYVGRGALMELADGDFRSKAAVCKKELIFECGDGSPDLKWVNELVG